MFLKVWLIILSSFTVKFPRFDRLRIKYNSKILACKQKQKCGWLGPFKQNSVSIGTSQGSTYWRPERGGTQGKHTTQEKRLNSDISTQRQTQKPPPNTHASKSVNRWECCKNHSHLNVNGFTFNNTLSSFKVINQHVIELSWEYAFPREK